EVDVAVEIVDVATRAGNELGGISRLHALDIAHLELHAACVLAHAAEHAHRVADVEALLEDGHAVPHARTHPAALVGELEIEEWASVSARATLLARHREGRVDERARRELAHERATGHSSEYTAAAARSGSDSGAEFQARADAVLDERGREPRGDRVDGAPPRAVGGHEVVGSELRERFTGGRDDLLEPRTAEMEASHDGVERVLAGQLPRVAQDVHDARVPAAGEDDEAAAAHVCDEGLVVEDQRVGTPACI